MGALIFTFIVFGFGFGAGYGIRELKSRRRRAVAREEWLRRQEEKREREAVGAMFSQAVDDGLEVGRS